jgi:hypothetical protein
LAKSGGVKAEMMDKTVLFLGVSSLKGLAFEALWRCFGNMDASTRIAGATADEEIRSKEGNIDTRTDMSFEEAIEQKPDVLVIADGITGNFVKNNLAATTLISDMFERNDAIIAIDDGVSALVAADIIRGLQVSAPESFSEQIAQAGGVRTDDLITISNNVFTASEDADMQMLCNAVAEYITSLSGGVAA